MPQTELLFSYETLRQPEVQLATFGRELEGRPDAIVGYDLDYVRVAVPLRSGQTAWVYVFAGQH
jgi:hypothetical protein